MSNPAVFELASANIGGQKVCIEDNIGESIHLHIGLVRFDMTVKEFQTAATTLQKILNIVTPNFFDITHYDAYFIERIAENLKNISAVEEILLPISELKICFEGNNGKFISARVTESPYFKYYGGEKINLELFENRGNIFQSNSERADKVLIGVKSNPVESFKLCADTENRILDGCLTAAAMAYFYGETQKVRVNRFHFERLDDSAVMRRRQKKSWLIPKI